MQPLTRPRMRTFRPARTMFLPVGDQWMALAARLGLVSTGETPLTALATSFMSYTLSVGLGPSPCRMANREPCRCDEISGSVAQM